MLVIFVVIFFFKQKTAYDMRISDWSSDVCSSALVSGISGSKVSDMATVAPALFPEMKRRGHKPPEMIALLATGAAMAETVPPSIVLIVLGSTAGVSIAGLFTSGFAIAMVLLLVLAEIGRAHV